MTSPGWGGGGSDSTLITSFIDASGHTHPPPHLAGAGPPGPAGQWNLQQTIPSLAGVLPSPVVATTWSSNGLMTTAASVAMGDLLPRGGRGRTDSTTYCCKCGSARADVRMQCCGKAVHGRCVYPWPPTFCPSCGKGGGELGIEVALPEPFRRNGEIVTVAEEETRKVRGGRWSEAECKFAEMVIEGFVSGMLPLRDGARLGTFLCNLLQCTSARLSSKLRTGKRNFKYLGGSGKSVAARPEEVFKHEQHQRQLSQQEELFLHYLSSEEAAVASHSLQLEWRLQFIELAQQLGIPVANLDEWGALLRPTALASSGSSSSTAPNAASALFPSVDPSAMPRKKRGASSGTAAEDQDTRVQVQPPAMLPPAHQQPLPMRGLAALMVHMAADRRRHFTVQDGVMGATTIEDLLGLLRQGPAAKCALLARTSNSSILFASPELQRLLGRTDTDLLGTLLMDQGGTVGAGLVHAQDALFLQAAFRQTQQQVNALVDRMGNPQLPVREEDLMPIPVVLRLRHRDHAFLSRQFTAFATEDFLVLYADSAPEVSVHHHPTHAQQHPHQRANSTPALEQDFRNMALEQQQHVNPPHEQPAGFQPAKLQPHQFSQGVGGSMPLPSTALLQSMAAQGVVDMQDKRETEAGGDGGGNEEEQAGGWGGAGEDDLEWAADEEMNEVLQTLARPSSPPTGDAWGGAYDLYYTPPASFEETMRSFLLSLPAQCFQCTDVWVPFRDPGTGRLSLQFGGGMALSNHLSQWIFYSRNFAFYEGQGMPGRIFRTQVPEYVEDVARLDNTLFLRRDGAQMAGVRASFGVPVVQDQMVFVLVFYSRHNSSRYITQEVLDFIRNSVASWRIQTAFSPSISSMSSASSTSSSSISSTDATAMTVSNHP